MLSSTLLVRLWHGSSILFDRGHLVEAGQPNTWRDFPLRSIDGRMYLEGEWPLDPGCGVVPNFEFYHLLVGCVVARAVWAWALRRWDKLQWLPTGQSELIQ
jgi:hypothetical protein